MNASYRIKTGLMMIAHNLNALDLLSVPVWIVSPQSGEMIFANAVARELMQENTFSQLREGIFSTHAQRQLPDYIEDLRSRQDIVEILTVTRLNAHSALTCRLSLQQLPEAGDVILFEGFDTPAAQRLKASRSAAYQRKKQGFYARFFLTNSAPMLLIDPARDGLIVDANLAALSFYGYSLEAMCQKHTWQINMLGRQILPVMHEIARLPGGHKPLYFVHRMADGSARHVQTYTGPIEIYGDRLMLCIIHDITEQKRLEQALAQAAARDALTGLLNRRQFYQLIETHDYSLLLIDTDRFRSINDMYGHLTGDEVLCALARNLETHARQGDHVFRWGGEEFILLLPHTSLEAALQLAEAIRVSVSRLTLPGLPRFTVSIGVARHEPEESVDELFRRVEAALCRAKQEGRNRVLAA
jgi:PAS domain S-box/diguanylate cyclase (GGDEF) domain